MARAAREWRQRARTIAYSLARALRALAGDLSWERRGRIALLVNAHFGRPGASWGSSWTSWRLLGLILGVLGPPGAHFGCPGAPLGSFWASWRLLGLIFGVLGRPGAHFGRPGASWGSSWASQMLPKWLPNGSPEASRSPSRKGAGTGGPYFQKNKVLLRREHRF